MTRRHPRLIHNLTIAARVRGMVQRTPEGVRASDVARELALSEAEARRMLQALMAAGELQRVCARGFPPSVRWLIAEPRA
jgi:DNA-binding IclR family transcriptional regulator